MFFIKVGVRNGPFVFMFLERIVFKLNGVLLAHVHHDVLLWQLDLLFLLENILFDFGFGFVVGSLLGKLLL